MDRSDLAAVLPFGQAGPWMNQPPCQPLDSGLPALLRRPNRCWGPSSDQVLVRRGQEPFKGVWAIPGGFKRSEETLGEAARRELSEETGVDVPSLLTQFGAYGDPGRDPRMNVVTVAYLAVLRDVGALVAGTDAAHAALEVSGIATAFVGTTFTMAELRTVYEAIWGVQLDAANFRRSLVGEGGWVIPTGRTARPGRGGGRPAELYRAGRSWKHGTPIHRIQPNRRGDVTQ